MPNISKAAIALLLLCSLARAEGINSGISIGGAEGINNSSAASVTPPSPPTVASVSPTSGPTGGGTSVSIGGTNYGTGGAGVTAIKFGATNAASFSCSSSTACSATSPAHVAGVVDVTVATAAGTSATSASDQFTYGYIGFGDVVAAKSYWAFRCYTTAYTGNVADIYAPADASHTLLTCSAGGVVNETLQALATTCAVSCTVKTLTDQAGGFNLSQATIATRPSVIPNCQNGRPCLQYATSNVTSLCSATGYAQAQPFSWSLVVERTGAVTGNGGHVLENNSSVQTYFRGIASSMGMFAASANNFTATDGAVHAIQEIFNNASSSANVDGAATSGTVGTNNMTATPICISAIDVAGSDTFRVMELAVVASALTGGNISALNANQHGVNGWNF